MRSLILAIFGIFLLESNLFAGECPPGYPLDCHNGYCCPSGTTCSSTPGLCNDGGGNDCPSGYPIDCGNGYCCPSGTTCLSGGQCQEENNNDCPSGYPIDCYNGYCCPANTSCSSTPGVCDDESSNGCPAGYPLDCGTGYCCPSDTTCSSILGRCDPISSGECPAGYPVDCFNGYCCQSGQVCSATPGICNNPGPQPGPNPNPNRVTCEGSSLDGCQSAQHCSDNSGSWYDADGNVYRCSGSSCAEALGSARSFCNSKKDDGCGCSDAPYSGMITPWCALGALAILVCVFFRFRRR